MIVRKQTIRFSPDRTPMPRKVKIGYESDNMVERLLFVLPDIAESQTATMMMDGEYANMVTLTPEDGRYYADMTAERVGAAGEIEAYIVIDGENGEVWNSGIFRLITGDVPEVNDELSERYPDAIGQMRAEIAAHRTEMEEAGAAAAADAERAEAAAGEAETQAAAAAASAEAAAGSAAGSAAFAEAAENAQNAAAGSAEAAAASVSDASAFAAAAENAQNAAADSAEAAAASVSDASAFAEAAENAQDAAAGSAEAAEEAAQRAETAADTAVFKADAIVCEASGAGIVLNDASNLALRGLKIFGKTTQDGTPTPESPAALASVGDGGSVTARVCGKNILSEGSFSTHTTAKIYNPLLMTRAEMILLPGVNYTLSFDTENTGIRAYFNPFYGGTSVSFMMDGARKAITITVDTVKIIAADKAMVSRDSATSETLSGYVSNVQLEISGAATAYEPYKDGGSVTASTPDGLPGIPVAGGGNYADANGQQWVCDEIDVARGVYVKRIGRIDSYAGESISGEFMSSTGALTTGATVLYALSSAVETALSDDVIDAYKTLHTVRPCTTVYSDAGAELSVEYAADTKTYIDRQIAAAAALLAN